MHPILIKINTTMKKLFVIAIAAFAFTACNNAGKTEGTNADSTTATAPAVTPEATAPAATPEATAPATTPEATAPATAPAH